VSRGLICVLLACGLGLGCARLPELHYVKVPLDPAAVVHMENSQGGVPPARAKAMLAKRQAHAPDGFKAQAALEEAATGRPLIAGNKVTLLFDGPETMDAMCAAIEAAQSTINLETYIFEQDAMGQRFADLLISRQRAGVRVKILYDAVGTLNTPEAFFTRMGEAGIQLCAFHPVNPLARLGRWKLNRRDHRKILVVDGAVAFTGGANISGTYGHGSLFRSKARAPRGPRALGWRDTHLRLEGPAVAALQWLFVENWESQTGEVLVKDAYFPQAVEAGNQIVRVVGSEPGSDFEIYRAYVLAMEQAERSIHLTSAYFVPDAQIVKALKGAAQRGVAVQILLTTVSDSGLVQHASQSYYSELLKAGIRVFQLRSSLLHAKTAVIDGCWSTVGSTNLDLRSFLHNKEVNVIVLGEGFGARLEDAFQEDLRNATEVDLATWERRPRLDRVKEWAARILAYYL
jgi:cardiolipin synthase